MKRGFVPALAVVAMLVLFGAPNALAAIQAPESAGGKSDTTTPACTAPTPDVSGAVQTYPWYHCYTPQDIRSWYGVDSLVDGNTGLGAG
jgi:hypothetical protein